MGTIIEYAIYGNLAMAGVFAFLFLVQTIRDMQKMTLYEKVMEKAEKRITWDRVNSHPHELLDIMIQELCEEIEEECGIQPLK